MLKRTLLKRGNMIKDYFKKQKEKRELRNKLKALGKWYYYINFNGVEVRKDLKNDPASSLNNWQFIKKTIPRIEGKTFLDVGCNCGLYDIGLINEGARDVVGIDRTEEHINQAYVVRDYFLPEACNLHYKKRDFESDMIDRHFDYILFLGVLYHMLDPRKAIEKASKLSNTLIVQCNTRRYLSSKYKHENNKYSGVEECVNLLEDYFGNINVYGWSKYEKPVIVASRERTK